MKKLMLTLTALAFAGAMMAQSASEASAPAATENAVIEAAPAEKAKPACCAKAAKKSCCADASKAKCEKKTAAVREDDKATKSKDATAPKS